eukprot:UN23276
MKIEKGGLENKIESLHNKHKSVLEVKHNEIEELKSKIEEIQNERTALKSSLNIVREAGRKAKTDIEVNQSTIQFLEKDKEETAKNYEEKIKLLKDHNEEVKSRCSDLEYQKETIEK